MDNQNTFAAGPSTVVTPSFTPQNVSTPTQSVPEPRREQTVQQLGATPTSQPYALEDLESPSTANLNNPPAPGAASPVNDQTRSPISEPPKPKNTILKRILISAAIVGVVVFLSAIAVVFISRNRQAPEEKVGDVLPEQQIDLSVGQAKGVFDLAIEGQEDKLIVNGSVVSRGDVVLTAEDESAYGQISAQNLNGVYTYLLPNAAGTFCLDSNNCNYLQETDVTTTTVAGASGALQLGEGLTINGNTIVNTATFTETAINNFGGAVTIQGTDNQVGVNNSGGVITLSTPQDLATSSSPTFSTITLTVAGTQNGNEICDISNNCGYAGGTNAFVQDGNTFGTTATLGTNDANDLVFETSDTARMVISASNGHVGLGNTNGITGPVADSCTSTQASYLGTSDCSSIIHIQELVTNSTEHIAGINNSLQISSSFDFSNSLIYGTSNLVVTDTGSTNDYGLIVGSTNIVNHSGDGLLGIGGGGEFLFENTGAGNVDSGYGITAEARHAGSGSVSSLQGASITAVSTNGTVFELEGLNVNVSAGGTVTSATGLSVSSRARVNGSVTTNIGVDVATGNSSGDGGGDNNSITDNYGIRIQSAQNGDGTVDNNYGLYVQDQAGIASGDNYNIYSAGSGYNLFEGHVGVGNGSTPLLGTATLSVVDTITTSGVGIANAIQVNAVAGNGDNTAILNELNTTGAQNYDSSIGLQSTIRNDSTGTTDTAVAIGAQILNESTGTITTATGVGVGSLENSGGGTVLENYGIYVQGQSAGTDNYGIRIDTADTQTLWLAGDEGTISSGIGFGSTRDVNLYRSAANVLRTDNAFSIGTLAATDNASYLCLNSGGIVAGCSGTTTGSAFVQGGNSFGATATLGTNDANILEFETNNTTRLTIGANNGRIIHTPGTITSTTAADDIAHTITFNDTGVVSTGTDITRGLSVGVSRTGATGSAVLTTYAGSFAAVGDLGGTSTASGIFSYGVGADSNVGVAGIGFQAGSNTTTSVIGVLGAVETYFGTIGGTVTTAYGLQGSISMAGGNSTYTTAAGLQIASATNGTGGTITSNYGVKIEAQTAGVSDYGLRVDAADTQTLWISGNADNTTAAAGIAFGASRDTNLYRSAADTLKTDDSIDVTNKVQIGTSGGTLTQCGNAISLFTCNNTLEQASSSTETTVQTYGANFVTGIVPAGATNTVENRAVGATLALYGTQSFSSSSGNYAIAGTAVNATTAGTVALLGAVNGTATQGGAGSTVTEAFGLQGNVTQITGTLSTGYGLRVLTATGTIGTNYGIHVQSQTAGTTDYGLRVDAADTQTLWISGNADNTTAAAGIAFGASRDTNLYRSAAATLATGATTFSMTGANGTISTATTNAALTLQSNGSGTLTLDSGTTGSINMGTGASAKTITIGNSTGATAVAINCGTGNCTLGTNAVAHTTTVGSLTGAATTTVQGGTGGVNLGTGGIANTIQIGNITGAVAQTINIGTNATASSNSHVNVGSDIGFSLTTIKSGTFGISFSTAGTAACSIRGSDQTLTCAGAGAGSERFGTASTAAGASSVAIGNSAQSAGTNGIAIGNSAVSFGNSDTIAIGKSATGMAANGVAIGSNAVSGNLFVSKTDAVAVGANTAANGNYSVALGPSANVGGFDYTVALGAGATNTAANQLVVGSNTAPITSGYFGNGVTNATPQGFALRATGGSAVGTAGAGLTLAGGAGTTTSTGSGGGALTLSGGAAGGSGANNGGDINIQGGAPTGAGSYGSVMMQNSGGRVGIGSMAGVAYKLDVSEDRASSYAANFFNDGNDANRYGIRIQAGADDASGTTYFLDGYDGDGTQVGYVGMNGGTFQLVNISDARTKTNIADTGVNALDVLGQLRVVDYNRSQNPGGPLITGFIAQEVQGVYNQAVSTSSSGLLGVSNDAFIPLLVKGVQDQQNQIDDLRAQIDALQAQTNGVSATNSSTSSTLSSLNVSGVATIQALTVKGSASIEGNLAVEGSITVGGDLAVEGHIIGNEDTRGVVTMPAGETEVEHTFATPYDDGNKPIITLTATNTFAPSYRVESDEDGFKVFFQNASSTPVKLNYQVQQ